MKRLLTLLTLMLFASAGAQDDAVQVSIRAFIVGADGTFTESTTAEPGDLIEYRVIAVNRDGTTLPSESVSVIGPVPESSTYVGGSATEDLDITVHYSEDGSFFDAVEIAPVRAVRWTLNYPLEPDEEATFAYRVTINGEASSADSSSGTGSAEAFTQAMFGHLGVIEISCPSSITDGGTGSAVVTCGQVESSFSLFRQGWDLYADYEGEVPVIPVPTSAWRSDSSGVFTREYNLNAAPYFVNFNELTEGQSLVTIMHGQ